MKSLFKLVLLCAYHILIHGTPYENQLAEDIKLSRLADHTLLRTDESTIQLQGIKSHTKIENCNQTFYSAIQYEQNNKYKFNQISSEKDLITQPKRNKNQQSVPTTRLDSKLKSILENHFTETIFPDHESFYKWLYHALNNGTENLWLKNEEWRKDFHFYPSDDLTSTPFPIPSRHQALYEWISYQIANVSETTHGKRVKRVRRDLHTTDSTFMLILEKHFTETIQPEFEPFYKWLYHNLDDGKVNIHKKNADWIMDHNFTPCEEDFLPNTPFPIPLRHQALYEYISQQAANTATTPETSRRRMKRDLGTTPMTEHDTQEPPNKDALKQKLEQHFTETIEPQHLEFYNWLYKNLDNGKVNIYQKIKEYMYDYFFTVAPVLNNTPFPIPFKHWALYDWIVQPKLNITRSTMTPTTPTPTTHLWKEFRSYFTNDADYKDKYNKFSIWYQQAIKNEPANQKDLLKVNVIDQAFMNSDSHEPTLFPIPSVYHSWYHWLRSFKSSTAPKATYDPLDEKLKVQLENYFNETIAPYYAPFYKWLYKELDNGQAHMYRKVGEWIADPDFYPSDPLTNKPFPIPYKHQPFYEYIKYKKANYTKGPRPTIDSKWLYDFI